MTFGGSQSGERRANIRRNIRVPVDMNLVDISTAILGKIQDISAGGMKVKAEITPAPLKIGDEVWFSVRRDFLKFQGGGKILWAHVDDTVGIKFTRLEKKSRRSLEDFLSLFVDIPISDN